MAEYDTNRRRTDRRGLLSYTRARVFLLIGLSIVLLLLFGCSTANNYKLPPWEVKRQEMTCDRTTKGLPPGLVCVCRQYGATWDCQVAKY